MYTLLLRLSAPLQSWGSGSLFDVRETDHMPTKSGVIGMLAAALGRRRDAPLEDLSRLLFGIRIDQQGSKIDDFQITQMGGRLNANLSHRAYLCDAIFLAGLSCEDSRYLEDLREALLHPRFSLFLGRRSCPPTQPLVLGIRKKDLYTALHDEEWQVPDWRRRSLFGLSESLRLRIVIDDMKGSGIKKDVPMSFSHTGREYGYRYVKEVSGRIVTREQAYTQTEHDPMQELR